MPAADLAPKSGSRTLYLAGDLVASAAACALVAIAVGSIVPAAWPPWVSMPVGMALGMAISYPLFLAVSPLLGMIEPMLKIMPGAMVAGMAVPMISGVASGGGMWTLAVTGAECGLGTALLVALADWLLRRGSAHAEA